MIAPVAPRIIALDPGPSLTGVCLYDPVVSEPVVYADVVENDELRHALNSRCFLYPGPILTGRHLLAVEMIASYGMPVGAETFDTCVWIGRFVEAWGGDHRLVYRREVKSFLCGSMKAKDPNVWQAILDRFGGKALAVGRKARPGPLYGVTSHARAALGVAMTVAERYGAGA